MAVKIIAQNNTKIAFIEAYIGGNFVQGTLFYDSPIGEILCTADELGLTGLRFSNEKGGKSARAGAFHVLDETKRWLDCYFSGKVPAFLPDLHLCGTPFQQKVWKILLEIEYGKTRSYGDIAALIKKNGGKACAQAVGGAVRRNPVCIIVPCHRVLGADGALTGYAEGLDKKIALLNIENIPYKN